MTISIDGNQATPTVTKLIDYRPPAFFIEKTDLVFHLDDALTRVSAQLNIKRNPHAAQADLELDGDELNLVSVKLNDRPLVQSEYAATPMALTVYNVPDEFVLSTTVEIHPNRNTPLMGLYLSDDILCTQCEAEGFRRITYYLDRPDVLSVFTTTLIADSDRYPVLLCNGNPVESQINEGEQQSVWHDPWPKPSYLFALVAGKLSYIEDTFTTEPGRTVKLRVYTQPHNVDKCDHAMGSLIKSMRWDEQVYGRHYDLDVFNIVAVDDFNMGAMENKSLNVFNSKYVLAKPETATDTDYDNITGVIGHEYFHNWSGNRVTCRDWFQLSLKEGFTVFRDQEFSADVSSRGVKRIEDVNILRLHQFKEDAGPTAHPVRPDSYVEINNFYTATIYNKGAEVVRMLHGLVGKSGFRKGCDLYFQRFDGRAVTIEDFIHAMEETNGIDLTQFRLWYSQAGTPHLSLSRHYDENERTFTLKIHQSCPDTPDQKDKKPFHIPVTLKLFDPQGQAIPIECERDDLGTSDAADSAVLSLRRETETFVFRNVPAEPVPSLLRGFSAPVEMQTDFNEYELSFLMAHDDDPFNRWDAGQQLAMRQMLRLVGDVQSDREMNTGDAIIEAWRVALELELADTAFQAKALTLPSESLIAEQMTIIDVDAVAQARECVKKTIATVLSDQWLARYQQLDPDSKFNIDASSQGRRALRNLSLQYYAASEIGKHREAAESLALVQLKSANNMTDELGALQVLVHNDFASADDALTEFYSRWQDESLVVDKWFAIQALAPGVRTLDRVKQLTAHPAFNKTNPNRVRALLGSFAAMNPRGFHAVGGDAYGFVADWIIELDALNPQVAARLATTFSSWRRFDAVRQTLMQNHLENIVNAPNLSRDVGEIVSKSLGRDAG